MPLRRQNLHSSAIRREVSDHGWSCDQMRFQESKPRGRLAYETVEENCEVLSAMHPSRTGHDRDHVHSASSVSPLVYSVRLPLSRLRATELRP